MNYQVKYILLLLYSSVPLEVNVKVENPLHVDCDSDYSEYQLQRQETSPDTVTSDPRSHGGDERCQETDFDMTLPTHPSLSVRIT